MRFELFVCVWVCFGVLRTHILPPFVMYAGHFYAHTLANRPEFIMDTLISCSNKKFNQMRWRRNSNSSTITTTSRSSNQKWRRGRKRERGRKNNINKWQKLWAVWANITFIPPTPFISKTEYPLVIWLIHTMILWLWRLDFLTKRIILLDFFILIFVSVSIFNLIFYFVNVHWLWLCLGWIYSDAEERNQLQEIKGQSNWK